MAASPWFVVVVFAALQLCGASVLDNLYVPEILLPSSRREMRASTEKFLLPSDELQSDRSHETSFRHAYHFGYGSANRDEVLVKVVRRAPTFAGAKFDITQWVTDHETRRVALGLTPTNSLVVCQLSGEIINATCNETETLGRPILASVYSIRRSSGLEVYVISALESDEKIFLQWFLVSGTSLETVGSPWILHRTPHQLVPFRVSERFKLVILNTAKEQQTADVYEFALDSNGVHLWLTQRIPLNEADKAAVNYVNELVYLSVSQGRQEVQVFEYKDNRFEIHTRVPSKGVMDICAFRVGFMSFLALSGEEPRVIRVPPSREKTEVLQFNSSVRRWLAVRVPTYRDEAILLAETDEGIYVVTWSFPSQFVVAADTECVVADGSDTQNLTCLVSLNGAAGIIINREAAILLPARTQATRNNLQVVSPEVFMAIVRLEHLPNPFQLTFGKVMYKRNDVQAQLQEQTSAVNEAKRKLKHVFKPDTVVTAPWTIQHVTTSNFEVSEHFNAQELQVGGIPWTNEDWHHLNSLELEAPGQLEILRNRVDELHRALTTAVFFDDEGNLNVSSSLEFDGSIQVQGKTVVQSAQITYLNDFPVSELLENIVQLGRPKTIGGHKQFSSVDVEDLYIRDMLNDAPVQPFASSAKPIEIEGNLIFTQPLTITGDLKSNRLNMSLLRTASNETKHEAHNITSLSLDRIEVQGFINGKPVSHFIERLAEKPQSSILNITGTLKIIGDLNAEYINGININQFIEQLVPLQSTEPLHIPGETFIQNCSVNNMEVALLNELSFPEEYVLQGGSANISGYKNFDNTLVVEHLDVSNSLDSVPIDQLITLDNAGHLAGDWTFENITIKEVMLVENDLDTGIIEMLKETAISQAVDVVINNLKVLEDIYISDPGFLQGFVYKGGEPQKIEAPKYFQGQVKVQELFLYGSLNNVNVDDFITLDTKQIIQGNFSFLDDVTMTDLNVDGTVLSVDLKNLSEDAIRLSMPEMCEVANIKFTEPLVVGNLWINILNGMNNEHFITLDSNQTLTEAVSFQTLEAEKLTVTGNVDTEHLVNDKDLRHVDEYRVSRRRDQKIMGNWKIGHAKVRKTLDIDHINDIPVSEFESHFMLPDFTSVTFNEIIVVGDVKTKVLNGFDMDDIALNAIWVNRENTITGNLTVRGSLIADDLNVAGTLNNEIVKHMAEDIVLEDEAVISFIKNKTFANGAHIKNIDCEYLNGRKLSDILTKSTDQFINGPITFTGPVEFTEDVSFLYLNGHPKSSWQGVYSYENGEHVINGDVNFTNSFQAENLIVSGMTHGLNVDEFFKGVVWRNDDAVVLGTKTFTSPVVIKDALRIADTYNGVNLNKFLENVVIIDYPGEIKGPVTFHQDVHADNGIIVVKNLKVDNIQNCSLSDWKTHAVYLDQSMPVMGSKIFEVISSSGPIKIDNLNKIDMDKIFLLHKDQYIPESLTFESVSTIGNVSVGGIVNEWRLDDQLANTLMLDGDQTVMSPKIFLEDTNVRRDLFLSGTVNGYHLKDIVTLDTDQTIHGVKSFHEMVVLSDMQVQGPVNGQDLESWSGKVVRTNSPLGEITGSWDVRGNVTVLGSVLGTGSVLDGVPLTEFITAQTSRQNFADKLNDDIEREKNKFCTTVQDLLETARKQTYTFQYLEGVQFFPMLHPILSSVHIKHSHANFLLVSYAGVCESLLLQWDILKGSFNPVLSLALGGVNTWVVLPASKNGDISLVSAGLSDCPYSGGNLWVAKRGKPVMFQHVETLGNWTRVEQSPLDPYTIFSLDVTGNLSEWKYIDSSTTLELIRSFGTASADIVNDPIKIHSLIATKSKSPWKLNENEAIGNKSHLVIATHKHNARVKGNHDDIKIFEGQPTDGQLFHRLHVTDPGSVLAIQFPHEKYIAFMEDSTWLQLYRYEGVAGFHKAASVQLLGAQLLQVVHLPAQDLLSLRPMLLLSLPAPNPGLYLLEMRMLGDPAPSLPLADDCFTD